MNPQHFFSVVLTVLLSTSGAASAQVTVTALGRGLEPIESTAAIRVQHADFTVTEGIAVEPPGD